MIRQLARFFGGIPPTDAPPQAPAILYKVKRMAGEQIIMLKIGKDARDETGQIIDAEEGYCTVDQLRRINELPDEPPPDVAPLPDDSRLMVVTATTLLKRSLPSKNGAVIGRLPKGTQVRVKGQPNAAGYVMLADNSGYLAIQYLSLP